jgi:hypothetical protein
MNEHTKKVLKMKEIISLPFGDPIPEAKSTPIFKIYNKFK